MALTQWATLSRVWWWLRGVAACWGNRLRLVPRCVAACVRRACQGVLVFVCVRACARARVCVCLEKVMEKVARARVCRVRPSLSLSVNFFSTSLTIVYFHLRLYTALRKRVGKVCKSYRSQS